MSAITAGGKNNNGHKYEMSQGSLQCGRCLFMADMTLGDQIAIITAEMQVIMTSISTRCDDGYDEESVRNQGVFSH